MNDQADAHTLTIGNKRQATKLSTDTLFKPVNGHTATRQERYDLGKYAHNLHGRTLDVPKDVVALWTERRRDHAGEYHALFCFTR